MKSDTTIPEILEGASVTLMQTVTTQQFEDWIVSGRTLNVVDG